MHRPTRSYYQKIKRAKSETEYSPPLNAQEIYLHVYIHLNGVVLEQKDNCLLNRENRHRSPSIAELDM
jgi:hypothetical protein